MLDAKCGPQKSHFSPGTMSEGLLQPLISFDLVHSWLAWSPSSTISCPLLTVRHYFSSQGNWQRSYNFFPKRVISGSEPSGLFCEPRAAFLLWFWFFPSFLHVWPVLLMASSWGMFLGEMSSPGFLKRLSVALQNTVLLDHSSCFLEML